MMKNLNIIFTFLEKFVIILDEYSITPCFYVDKSRKTKGRRINMKNYEIMFIVKPTLSEEEVKKVVSNFENVLTSNGATITENKAMGQRELAYEIKKFNSGYYFLFTLEAKDDKAIKEFDRLALISNDIIRHLITNLEK